MNNSKTKGLSILLLMVVSMFALAAISTALPVTFNRVEVNDVPVSSSGIIKLAENKNSEIEVQVVLTSVEDLGNVQVEAVMRGYDHDDLIEDISDAFDMKANVTYDKKLILKLPIRMDKDTYTLRIRAEDRAGVTTQAEYHIQVEAQNHEIYVRDVVFNPEGYVKAGRALLTTVRVKNIGEQDEDGVKVKVSVPALGVSASDYIDKVEEDESTTSEELYMRIPVCAKAGDYDVKVMVEYDEGDEVITMIKQITVVEGDVCPGSNPSTDDGDTPSKDKTVISVGVSSQEVTAGEGGSIYPVTVTNQGSSSKTYSLSVDVPGDWASYQVSPSNVVVVRSGETATMYVYVSAKADAPVGENMFSLTMGSDGETLKQIPLKATVVEGEKSVTAGLSWNTVKQVLYIGLVVLVVLLVILGLIIGFQRLKGDDDDEEDESGKTYY